MMLQGHTISGVPLEAILANSILAQSSMSSGKGKKGSVKKDFDPKGGSGTGKPVLFKPEQMDIYCDKTTGEVFMFHSPVVDYDSIDFLEYNPADYSIDVVLKSGGRMDLGVKIQWLVRPWVTKAKEIMIVQTKDGESINGRGIPIRHKEKK